MSIARFPILIILLLFSSCASISNLGDLPEDDIYAPTPRVIYTAQASSPSNLVQGDEPASGQGENLEYYNEEEAENLRFGMMDYVNPNDASSAFFYDPFYEPYSQMGFGSIGAGLYSNSFNGGCPPYMSYWQCMNMQQNYYWSPYSNYYSFNNPRPMYYYGGASMMYHPYSNFYNRYPSIPTSENRQIRYEGKRSSVRSYVPRAANSSRSYVSPNRTPLNGRTSRSSINNSNPSSPQNAVQMKPSVRKPSSSISRQSPNKVTRYSQPANQKSPRSIQAPPPSPKVCQAPKVTPSRSSSPSRGSSSPPKRSSTTPKPRGR